MINDWDSISAAQTATMVTPSPNARVPVELEWRVDDPLCVVLTFADGPRAVVWQVARDVLAAGLVRPAGMGDVVVRPYALDPRSVELFLSSPAGFAVLLLDRVDLDGFIAATEHRVPIGAEQIAVPDFVPADIEEAQ